MSDLEATILEGTSKVLVKKSLKSLPAQLFPGESISAITTGIDENDKTALLALTDQRVIAYRKGMMGEKLEDFGLDKITSVEASSGMMLAEIKIHASGNKVKYKNMNKKAAKLFSEQVRNAISGGSHATTSAAHDLSSGDDTIEKLKELAKLRDQGILTEDEFSQQKAKLLK